MNVAIVGTGPIGSTFALHLGRAGHDVTVIARPGKRLDQLQADGAIVTVKGERVPVTVNAALDPSVAYDLVLVTVLASGCAAVLPVLKQSAARKVMFMFNTFESLQPLREAVGAERFAFGFPAILATLPAGRLAHSIYTRGQRTLSTDPEWAKVFTDSGIATDVHHDIESWLRTHAVGVVAFMSLGWLAHSRQGGISWAEAMRFARALGEGFSLVRHLGNSVTPSAMVVFDSAPKPLVAALLWAVSRSSLARSVGAIGPGEPRTLVDAMVSMAPERTALLRAIRP